MKILLLEPFFTGSHKQWALDFQQFSTHEILILPMSGYHWKWRMHIGAVDLAERVVSNENSPQFKDGSFIPDLILATDMIDLAAFLGLTRKWSAAIPTALYFHENQLNYPWSPSDEDVKLKRDGHYAFINYTSALASDAIFFNSNYHQNVFLKELPKFLKAFPDYPNLETVEKILAKSTVLHLGLDLSKLDKHKPAEIVKQQRAALYQVSERGIDFKLVVLGESYEKQPPIFAEAKEKLAQHILHFGYVEDYNTYCKWLWEADILPVTSVQDFFGASVVEAMYCNTIPMLPKRLAYPEHIPLNLHHTFFYEENEFVDKLQKRIMDVRILRIQNSKQFVKKYDWRELIPIYDAVFEI